MVANLGADNVDGYLAFFAASQALHRPESRTPSLALFQVDFQRHHRVLASEIIEREGDLRGHHRAEELYSNTPVTVPEQVSGRYYAVGARQRKERSDSDPFPLALRGCPDPGPDA